MQTGNNLPQKHNVCILVALLLDPYKLEIKWLNINDVQKPFSSSKTLEEKMFIYKAAVRYYTANNNSRPTKAVHGQRLCSVAYAGVYAESQGQRIGNNDFKVFSKNLSSMVKL